MALIQNTSPISRLPTELLEIIFMSVRDVIHIPNVCRRWRLISKEKLILDEYDYEGYQPKRVRIEAVKINKTLRMFKRVKNINLFNFEFVQCSILRAALHDLPFPPVLLTLSDLSGRWKRSTLSSFKEYVEQNHIPTYVFTMNGKTMYGCGLYDDHLLEIYK